MSYDLILRSKRILNKDELTFIGNNIKVYAEMLGGELLSTKTEPLGVGERLGTIVFSNDPWDAEQAAINQLLNAIKRFDLSLHDPQTGESINNH